METNTKLNIKLSKSNIDFVKPKESTEAGIDETKEVVRFKIEEKKKSLYEQLKINEQIKQNEFEEIYKARGPKALDEEESRFLEEARQKLKLKDKQTKESIEKEIQKFEKEVSEISKDDLQQNKLFPPPIFAKKRKNQDELNLEVNIIPKEQKNEKLETKKNQIEKNQSRNVKKIKVSLVSYEGSDSE